MPEQQHSVGILTHLSSAATGRPRMFSPFSCDLGERREKKSDDESECHKTRAHNFTASQKGHDTRASPAQCVSLQKDNTADSPKGDIILIPCADSARYMTGPLFHGWEDKSTLFFTLGAIWHFSS